MKVGTLRVQLFEKVIHIYFKIAWVNYLASNQKQLSRDREVFCKNRCTAKKLFSNRGQKLFIDPNFVVKIPLKEFVLGDFLVKF